MGLLIFGFICGVGFGFGLAAWLFNEEEYKNDSDGVMF